MFEAYDVLNFAAEERVFFGDQTIFAKEISAPAYLLADL
jgi:hypothetical protein